MSGNKVKGLLKGLRYISQIFENEKEQEIQIGFPTDVKHVAHIGWDGPSVNSPSWMNEFKSTPGFASAPLTGDVQSKAQDNPVQWISEDSRRRSSRCVNSRDMPDLPKASRKQPTGGNITDSPTRERSRQSRKSSNKPSPLNKDSSDGPNPTQQPMPIDDDAQSQPDIPKRTRRKKSKDNSSASGGGGSSKLRSKAQPTDPTLDFGSPSKARNKPRTSFEEDEQCERELSRIS